MRRVLAAALFALSACRPGEPEAPGAPPAVPVPAGEPAVRVGIAVDSPAVVVGASTDYELRSGTELLAGERASGTWSVVARSGELEATDRAGRTVRAAGTLQLTPRGGGTVVIDGRDYRGEVLLIAREGDRVTAVNLVDLEAYLLGVVPREIGRRPASEIEAIKAQAVAARTYAIGNLRGRASLGFDFFATVQDQVYGGTADEDSIVSRAVRETRGEILTHDGRPILAYYSSTCGGRTAAIEQSWPWRAPQPYLKSVSDMVPGTDSAYCSFSNRYRWSARWTRDELLSVLSRTLPMYTGAAIEHVDNVRDVAITGINEAGRADVRLLTGDREYLLRADSLRWVLRPPPGSALLNSSRLFELRPQVVDGRVQHLEAHGGGWGHGIGMCQVGAMGRARAGQSYAQILNAYYTGTELSRLY